MKKWQHERNYRMIKVNNQVIAYQISVEGKSIEVTKEVYQAYAQMDRRERYLKEADMTVGLLCIPELLDRQAEPAEEDDNTSIDATHLRHCLAQLSKPDQVLIHERYWAGKTQKEVAQKLHITQQAVSCRETRILARLKAMLEEGFTG